MKQSDYQNSSENTTLVPASELLLLPENEILEKLMEHESPRQLVQQVSQEDFFWLIKKVGNDDCFPLLRMASDEQKQYLLDLEFWEKDRLDMEKAHEWFGRLHLADPRELARWFFTKGESLIYYYLFKNIQVEVRDEDEDQELEGKFTLDGTFFITVLEERHRETIENMLRNMAAEDLERYQSLLSNLGGVISAEMEEDMFRIRNVRLAEHGFLPPEEALKAYAHLSPEKLNVDEPDEPVKCFNREDVRELISISPLYHAQGDSLLTNAFAAIGPQKDLDRLRLEFAGLCNQLISADGIWADDLSILIKTCSKAAGHLNLALEKVCGTSVDMAEKILVNNSLESIFRVGFAQVLELKWEAERWYKESWFKTQGLSFGFWGDEQGNRLAGILENKPRNYAGIGEDEGYKAFETLSEIEDCRNMVHQVTALDYLLRQLENICPMDPVKTDKERLLCHQMIFNIWAHQLLNIEQDFSGLTVEKTHDFFSLLRKGEKKPPYKMAKYENIFTRDLMEKVPDISPLTANDLKTALSFLWRAFVSEYEWVATEDIDERFMNFLGVFKRNDPE